MSHQPPRRAAVALLNLMNSSEGGRQKLTASIICSVLGHSTYLTYAVDEAMEAHGLPIKDNVALAADIGLRLDIFRDVPKSTSNQRLLEKVLSSDRATLRLARMIAETELVETDSDTQFAEPISLIRALPNG